VAAFIARQESKNNQPLDRTGFSSVVKCNVTEQRTMPTFMFWYAVFLVGSAVGATAGSTFDNGFAVVAGLFGGTAISGWIAQQLPSKGWSSVPDPEKLFVQPKQTGTPALGLERIRFASASLSLEAFRTTAAEHDTLGAFSLPKGMYEFAIEKQTSPS
jgi:hypothetical protein